MAANKTITATETITAAAADLVAGRPETYRELNASLKARASTRRSFAEIRAAMMAAAE